MRVPRHAVHRRLRPIAGQNLVDSRVDESTAPSTDAPTTLALAWLDDSGTASYLFYVDGTSAAELSTHDAQAVVAKAPRVLYVGTLGLVLEPGASSVEDLVGSLAAEVLLVVDPNCRPTILEAYPAARDRLERILRRADVVKVSTEDAGYLYPDRPPVAAAEEIRRHGGSTRVLQRRPPTKTHGQAAGCTRWCHRPDVQTRADPRWVANSPSRGERCAVP
jgi:sugar/nucleoside kinase (ribokinase family)